MNEELKVAIKAETDEFSRQIEKAQDEIEDFGGSSEASMKAFDKAVEGAKKTAKVAFAAVAAAITGAVTAMTALAESTREYRTNQAKLTTAFREAGASAETAKNVYNDLYAVLGDDGQSTEAAAHLAKLTSNEKELAEWTTICTGVYATFGDSLPIEGLTEAANETAKTGAVTGVLADALNWAGVSEDEFNEALAACNDEAEREKLIRETLNKLYSKSAAQYEKTAKKTLEANRAQAKLNASLAKIADAVEPLITEFKKMGAAILEKVTPYIKDLANWISNKLLPVIKKTIEQVKQNKTMIIGILSSLTAGTIAYKTATLLATAAEKGITAATLARAAAQKVLNAAMAASPVGLLAAGVATLTAGIIAFAVSQAEASHSVNVLTEAELELVDAAREASDVFREQQEVSKETSNTILAEKALNEELVDELFSLVDANGHVQEADRARVDFILGELNNAYGTEYEMVDGVILRYDELEQSIRDVMDAKTAEALLDVNRDDYIYALEHENEALQAVQISNKDYQAQLQITHQARKELADAELALNSEIQASEETRSEKAILAARREVVEKRDILEEQEGILAEKKAALDKDAANYANYSNTIITFENAQAAAIDGNSSETIRLLTQKGAAVLKYSKDVAEATQTNIDNMYKEAIEAGICAQKVRKNWEKGVEGYTYKMVEEAEQTYNNLLGVWADTYMASNAIGTDFGNGMINGMSGTRSRLIAQARQLACELYQATKQELDIHSPSRKTKELGVYTGKGLEVGLEQSTKDVVGAAKEMARATLIPLKGSFDGFSMAHLPELNLKANAAFSSSLPTLEIDNRRWVEELVQKLNTNQDNTPIILQVDGKTFGEVSISSINNLTKQRGYLPLVLG